MENKLNTRAMLVALSVRMWLARKYDRKVSDEIAEKHKASKDAGRYNKNLLPVEAPSYKAIAQAMQKARSFHYEQTLPWSDEGSRILTAENYMAYTEGMREHRNEFEVAVAQFLPEYPSLHEAAKRVSGSLFKEEDYPRISDLPGKFGFNMKFFPLPDAGDFRVNLKSGDVDSIRQQIEHDTHAAIEEAVGDLYKRLHVAVSHMTEKLSDKDGKFKNTLVSNVQEICDLIPRLNLTKDRKLDQMRRDIEGTLTAYEADDLRTDKKLRKKVAAKAQEIENDLAAFMGR